MTTYPKLLSIDRFPTMSIERLKNMRSTQFNLAFSIFVICVGIFQFFWTEVSGSMIAVNLMFGSCWFATTLYKMRDK
jgi:hypothetical protein